MKLTRDAFCDLRHKAQQALRRSKETPSVLICAGTGCIAGGALKIYENLKNECESRGLPVYIGLKHDSDEEKSLHIKMSGCHGFCEMGPLVHIEPMGIMYIHVKPEDCHEILEKTVLGGEIIDRLVYRLNGVAYPRQEDIPFYKKQHRVVLENCGTSDAQDIEEYIAKGGYSGFERALFEMTDEQICRDIIDSGLRGRGGGGFPAGQKWDGARRQQADKKYIVCNGDEGDPGAFMDRSIMEGNPHSVLEGMMIAGLAAGSDEGYIYVRAEYPLAVSRLKTAIEKAQAAAAGKTDDDAVAGGNHPILFNCPLNLFRKIHGFCTFLKNEGGSFAVLVLENCLVFINKPEFFLCHLFDVLSGLGIFRVLFDILRALQFLIVLGLKIGFLLCVCRKLFLKFIRACHNHHHDDGRNGCQCPEPASFPFFSSFLRTAHICPSTGSGTILLLPLCAPSLRRQEPPPSQNDSRRRFLSHRPASLPPTPAQPFR